VIVQLIVAPLILRSRARLGIAMFTAVMSRMTISWAMSRTKRSTPLPLPVGDSESAG
jgi:hypothetical protein